MRVQAVVFDIGNVLIEWNPVAFRDRENGPAARARLFEDTAFEAMNHAVDAGASFRATVQVRAATARGWRGHLFKGPEGWANRVARVGLLNEKEAA